MLRKLEQTAGACTAAVAEIKELLNNSRYIDRIIFEEQVQKYLPLFESIGRVRQYRKLSGRKASDVEYFVQVYKGLWSYCQGANKKFIAAEKQRWAALFDNSEGKSLDNQQRDCIVKEEINHIVVAGAGSGKTTTIVGKVRYLLERYQYLPSELLVLSFTNASAAEMAVRIRKETNQDIDVMTFHKLGKEIIARVEGKQPSVSRLSMDKFIRDQFKELLKDPAYLDLLARFFLLFGKQYRDAFQFKSQWEYNQYLKESGIVTLKGETVKSYGEMVIANFLFTNNIDYVYEAKYPHDLATLEYGQYCPDFFLPEYDVYIEHFGIDRQGNVPPFFSSRKGMPAKAAYHEGMKWKRQVHEQYETPLAESYFYELSEGTLTEGLVDKLSRLGVAFCPLTWDELWALLNKKTVLEMGTFSDLLGTFISHMKANQYTPESLAELNEKRFSGFARMRNSLFLQLIGPLFFRYQGQLARDGDIDFNDMITRATDYCLGGSYNSGYKYIIVDEFQDISVSRYKLIKAIKDQNQCRLFCVGDDWQSIYRFAGSAISIFTGFDRYFGYAEKSYIETTYRFPPNIIDLSGNFIQKNPGQIKKNLRSLDTNYITAFALVYSSGQSLKGELKRRLSDLPQGASVLLLGRYNLDIDDWLDSELSLQVRSQEKIRTMVFTNRRDLKMRFMTVHGAKGLEADYVFVLNNKKGNLGFPSEICDDPVLDMVLQGKESYPYAEERRLFYVALTRTRNFVYLMIDSANKSAFIQELESNYPTHTQQALKKANYCPACKQGRMVLRRGRYGNFRGCSSYPKCSHTEQIGSRR